MGSAVRYRYKVKKPRDCSGDVEQGVEAISRSVLDRSLYRGPSEAISMQEIKAVLQQAYGFGRTEVFRSV